MSNFLFKIRKDLNNLNEQQNFSNQQKLNNLLISAGKYSVINDYTTKKYINHILQNKADKHNGTNGVDLNSALENAITTINEAVRRSLLEINTINGEINNSLQQTLQIINASNSSLQNALTQIETEKTEALSAINKEKDKAIDSVDSELVKKLDEVYSSLAISLQESLNNINNETQVSIAAVDNEKQKAIEEIIGAENSVKNYIDEININLLMKIDYIFNLLCRADSNEIMEKYPREYIV
jgi:hypothetical protein